MAIRTPRTSYHVHSVWSDGETSVRELVEAGEALGLREMGISDHFVIHPSGVPLHWSMPVERVHEYADRVLQAANDVQIPVKLGVEVDYIPETFEQTMKAMEGIPFDYIIGALHFGDGFPLDKHRRYWASLTQEEVNETWRLYYLRLRELASLGAFDILAHFDLPKKFGYYPTVDLTAEVLAALDAVAASGMVMEINTAGLYKVCAETYPPQWIVDEAWRRGIPIVITSDAHSPEHLLRSIDTAVEMARRAGYETVTRFEGRRRITELLE